MDFGVNLSCNIWKEGEWAFLMPKRGFFSCSCSWQSDTVLGRMDKAESEATQSTDCYLQ